MSIVDLYYFCPRHTHGDWNTRFFRRCVMNDRKKSSRFSRGSVRTGARQRHFTAGGKADETSPFKRVPPDRRTETYSRQGSRWTQNRGSRHLMKSRVSDGRRRVRPDGQMKALITFQRPTVQVHPVRFITVPSTACYAKNNLLDVDVFRRPHGYGRPSTIGFRTFKPTSSWPCITHLQETSRRSMGRDVVFISRLKCKDSACSSYQWANASFDTNKPQHRLCRAAVGRFVRRVELRTL